MYLIRNIEQPFYEYSEALEVAKSYGYSEDDIEEIEDDDNYYNNEDEMDLYRLCRGYY